MRWFGLCFFVMAVTLSAFAQRADTASGLSAEARVVRLEMGHVCGLCGGPGYRTSLTIVERSFVLREMMDSGDPKKYPNRKERHAITKREWEALLQSIDLTRSRPCRRMGAAVRVSICGNLGLWWNIAITARSQSSMPQRTSLRR